MTRDILEPFLGPNSLLVYGIHPHVVPSTPLFATPHQSRFHRLATAVATQQCSHTEVILRALFGIDDHDELVALLVPLRTFLSLGGSLTILAPPLREQPFVRRKWERFKALHDEIDRAILTLIRERRAETQLDTRTDILSALVRATDESGEPLADPVVCTIFNCCS